MQATELSTEEESDLNFLYNEIHRLRTQWACFEQLFIGDAPGREYLHANAPRLMEVIRPALVNDILLTICRLCDPKEKRRKNFTVEHLALAHFLHLPNVRRQINELRKLVEKEFTPIRNRRSGHNDRDTIRGTTKVSVPLIGRMRRAVALCTEIVSELHTHYGLAQPDVCLEQVVNEITWLETALRYFNDDDKDIARIQRKIKAVRLKFERPKKKS